MMIPKLIDDLDKEVGKLHKKLDMMSQEIREVETFLTNNNPGIEHEEQYENYTYVLKWSTYDGTWRLNGTWQHTTKPVIEWAVNHRKIFHNMIPEFLYTFKQKLNELNE